MKRINKSYKLSQPWFAKRHWSYIPICVWGWLTYIPFISFLLFSLNAVSENTDSIAGAMFDAFPYWVCAVIIMHWFASHKS